MATSLPRRPRAPGKLAVELGARSSLDGAIDSATRLLDQLRGFDFRSFEAMVPEVAVPNLVAGPVAELTRALIAATRLLRSLPGVLGIAEDGGAVDDADTLVDAEIIAAAPATEGAAQPERDRFAEDLDALLRPGLGAAPPLGDSGPFLAARRRSLEALYAALDALRQARRQGSKWGLITAAEEGRRKAQKGVRAVFIMGVRQAAPRRVASLFPRDRSELETALAVRAALMEFRRDIGALLAPLPQLPDLEAGLLMRDVRVRMLQLFGDASYHAVRAPDRYVLQQLCGRLSAWLDHAWNDFAAARAALADVAGFVAGLERINARATLREHDREVRGEALQRLADLSARPEGVSKADAARSLAGALREARRMAWRSAELDGLLAAAQDGVPDDEAVVLQRAAALQAALAAIPLEASGD